ncbi:MAG TPA: nuclear transport factor 2 family protein [Acetobacteraceae bacterium]|nr:nuclear transport factor 2 family protein [Acetobacteraceae bacterium]
MTSALEEKDAIREVLATYCFHLDAANFEAMAALFTEDGTWHTDFGKGTGRVGIIEHARSLRTGDAPRPRGVHLTTNIVIELDGDSARVQSNWIVAQNTDAGPKVSSAGGYADDMVKQNGRWLFRYRRIDRFIAEGKF